MPAPVPVKPAPIATNTNVYAAATQKAAETYKKHSTLPNIFDSPEKKKDNYNSNRRQDNRNNNVESKQQPKDDHIASKLNSIATKETFHVLLSNLPNSTTETHIENLLEDFSSNILAISLETRDGMFTNKATVELKSRDAKESLIKMSEAFVLDTSAIKITGIRSGGGGDRRRNDGRHNNSDRNRGNNYRNSDVSNYKNSDGGYRNRQNSGGGSINRSHSENSIFSGGSRDKFGSFTKSRPSISRNSFSSSSNSLGGTFRSNSSNSLILDRNAPASSNITNENSQVNNNIDE